MTMNTVYLQIFICIFLHLSRAEKKNQLYMRVFTFICPFSQIRLEHALKGNATVYDSFCLLRVYTHFFRSFPCDSKKDARNSLTPLMYAIKTNK